MIKFHTEWYDQLPSTNSHLKEMLSQAPDLPGDIVVATRDQTSGRGRHDRVWESVPGQNLCFSVLIRTQKDLREVPSLTLAAALAVDDLLQAYGVSSHPKWPNDVLVKDAKICGILSEYMHPPGSPVSALILGIGLNVNMDETAAAAIDRPATSLAIETGRNWDIEDVLNDLLQHISLRLPQWQDEGFAGFAEEWMQRTQVKGKHISVHEHAYDISGVITGFGPHGELMIKDDAGEEQSVWSGEIE